MIARQNPKIELKWKEPGMAFRVSFVKVNYAQQQELQYELQYELQHELQHESLYTKVLLIVKVENQGTRGIAVNLGQKNISGQLKKTINKLLENRLVEWTIPETPKSPKQQYRITDRGIAFLQLLNKN